MKIGVLRPLLCTRWAKWAEQHSKVMKRTERWSTLQVWSRRDSNTGDLWSNTMPLDHEGGPDHSPTGHYSDIDCTASAAVFVLFVRTFLSEMNKCASTNIEHFIVLDYHSTHFVLFSTWTFIASQLHAPHFSRKHCGLNYWFRNQRLVIVLYFSLNLLKYLFREELWAFPLCN